MREVPSALDATLSRLNDQLTWYNKRSQQNQWFQRASNISQITVASAIPITAWLLPPLIPALLGALVAVLKGLEATFQWEYNWINYRATAEKLKHEKFLFEATAGPYGDDSNPQRLLAERVEGVVSREHASWITLRSERTRGNEPKPSA